MHGRREVAWVPRRKRRGGGGNVLWLLGVPRSPGLRSRRAWSSTWPALPAGTAHSPHAYDTWCISWGGRGDLKCIANPICSGGVVLGLVSRGWQEPGSSPRCPRPGCSIMESIYPPIPLSPPSRYDKCMLLPLGYDKPSRGVHSFILIF